MPHVFRRIEIPHCHVPVVNDLEPVDVEVLLEVGLEFDDDAELVGRGVTELIVHVRDYIDESRATVRIPVDFADQLATAFAAASHRAAELHLTPQPATPADRPAEEDQDDEHDARRAPGRGPGRAGGSGGVMTQTAGTAWGQVRDLAGARARDQEEAGTDVRLRPLTDPEVAATVTVGLLVGVLGVIGLVTSFATVAAAARPAFGGMAWMVPLGIDVGILVFSALDLVLARLDMRVVWLRLVPWSLTAATIYLNIADEATLFGQVAHAVLPALWVVAIEVGTHAVRVRAGLASARRMDTIRRSRWLLAPASTLGLWRRMVLWEITAYTDALARERSRLLALTDLKDRYGFVRLGRRRFRFPAAWRWNAPRRERALYRLGELTPTDQQDAVQHSAESVPAASPARRFRAVRCPVRRSAGHRSGPPGPGRVRTWAICSRSREQRRAGWPGGART